MTNDTIRSKLQDHNLGSFYEHLAPLLRRSTLLMPVMDEKRIIGGSRIGGIPDLPPEIDWPWGKLEVAKKKFFGFGKSARTLVEKPMSFIAQINLSEMTDFDTSMTLPHAGILYFFYDSEQSVWGFDPKDASMFKVLFYTGSIDRLRPTEFPEGLEKRGRFKGSRLEMRSETSIPSTDHEVYDELSEDDLDWFMDEFYKEEEIHKIGGYADGDKYHRPDVDAMCGLAH